MSQDKHLQRQLLSFHVSGMHCASCASNVQRGLGKTEGVLSSNVNYGNHQATLEIDPSVFNEKKAQDVVEKLGYHAHIGVSDSTDLVENERNQEIALILKHLKISSVLTVFLLFSSMVSFAPQILQNHYLQLVLASVVQFVVGKRYYKSALSALKNRTTNMDTLIALGTSVAYFFSIFVTFFKETVSQYGIETHVYFETSATIITLILLGKYLEISAQGKTSQALKKLIGLQAKHAHLIVRDAVKEVAISQVKVGDRLLVKPGEKIPTDGVIVSGESSIDESMVTGESIPLFKHKNSVVIGATINTSGSFEMEVRKVGQETMLATIIQLVRTAQGSRPPIQKLVDTVSAYFVPAVIVIAFVTALVWLGIGPEPRVVYALVSLISVLIIACPCALGLATPISLIVGIGKGAQKGILIKNAEGLEIANKVTTMLFDKTGTITIGKPQVTQIEFTENTNETKLSQLDVESMIYSVESKSHHPLATAVVTHFEDGKHTKLPVSSLLDVSGKGIQAVVSGKKVIIGTVVFLEENNCEISKGTKEKIAQWQKLAQTVSLVAVERKLIAIIGIKDTVRPESKIVIQKLKSMGIEPMLLTGDSELTAQTIAHEVGIQTVYSQVLPAQKEKKVVELRKMGKVVAFVGDGINDAPALAAADVSIAMGQGTDVAIEAAAITLLRSDISLVPSALLLSKATLINIKQNLVWAFGYNVILIPVAMGVLYPRWGIQLNPMLASLAMALSSVCVVLNALRLQQAKIDL